MSEAAIFSSGIAAAQGEGRQASAKCVSTGGHLQPLEVRRQTLRWIQIYSSRDKQLSLFKKKIRQCNHFPRFCQQPKSRAEAIAPASRFPRQRSFFWAAPMMLCPVS